MQKARANLLEQKCTRERFTLWVPFLPDKQKTLYLVKVENCVFLFLAKLTEVCYNLFILLL